MISQRWFIALLYSSLTWSIIPMKMLLYLSASSVSPTCMMMITVIMIMMIIIMSDLDAQGLSAAVQSGEDHVAAPGVVVYSVPAHHGEDVRVSGGLPLHHGGHWWALLYVGRCAGHEEARESVHQPHANTYSAQLELNGQNYVLGNIRSCNNSRWEENKRNEIRNQYLGM